MIIRFIKSRLRYKIMFFLFILMTASSLLTIFTITENIKSNNLEATKKNLVMLNESIFQSLRNAMNTGDPLLIAKSEEKARTITGVRKLEVAKSKSLIELYSLGAKFTKDKNIQAVFKSKETQLIEYDNETHDLRMIKPMVATEDCLTCHVNQKKGDVIGVMDLTYSLEDSDNYLVEILTNVFLVSTLLGWSTLIITYFLLQKATQPIENLEEGIKNLLDSNGSNQKITITTQDEVAKVTKYFNSYIEKIDEGLKADQALIKEAKTIIEQVKHGNYNNTIQGSSDNEILNQFKDVINDMIFQTKEHFNTINSILQQYSNYDYTQQIVLDNVDKDGVFGSLTGDINNLQTSITNMLIECKSSGMTLDETSDVLLEYVEQLSKNTNSAAVSLEETSGSLDEVTSNISSTTKNIIDMVSLTSNVTQSAQKGEQLANNTTRAMDDINNEISAIKSAIAVIDKIAFQTNILSLNASVEAATAGDVGNGFAVVAGEVRNLAERSSKAANEIKALVDNATQKANNGKLIATEMITGYNNLKENISKTTELIHDIELSSKQQLSSINQINNAIGSLDSQTQQNANIATKTNEIAIQIDTLSKRVVSDANEKEFIGKDIENITEVTDLLAKEEERFETDEGDELS